MENEQELKNAEATASAQAQAGISLEDELSLEAPQAKEDDVESLKARLAKAEEERENYKKGMLKYKRATRGEDSSDEDNEEDTEEASTINQAQDVKQIAVQAATELLEKTNEKTAISQFTSKYPALKDPVVWRKVVENYNSKNGKASVSNIMEDLEAALILARHYGGGKVADREISLNNFATVSFAGSIAPHSQQSDLPESTIEMGRYFKSSVEDLKKAAEPGGNEIQIA